jgi:hypothetical protein
LSQLSLALQAAALSSRSGQPFSLTKLLGLGGQEGKKVAARTREYLWQFSGSERAL